MEPCKKDKMIGQIFGRLTVVGFSHKDKKYNPHYWCRCSCSEHALKIVRLASLKDGTVRSCGCYGEDLVSAAAVLRHLRLEHKLHSFRPLSIKKWSVEEIAMRYRQAHLDGEQTILKEAAEELVVHFSALFDEYLFALNQIDALSNHEPYLYTFFRKVLSDEEWDRFLGKTNYTFAQRWEILKSSYQNKEEMVTDLTESLLSLTLRYDGRGKFKRYIVRALPYRFADLVFARYRKNLAPRKKLSDFMEKIKMPTDDLNVTEEMLEDSTVFSFLTERDRKILILYYAKNCPDKVVGEIMGLHINTVNQYRNQAVEKLRWKIGLYNEKMPARHRKSGKKIIA